MRWGFLGASRIGRRALAPAVLEAGHTLHAVAARDIGRAREFADAFGAADAYGDYFEMLRDPAIDAIYNALPNDQHLSMTIAAMDAGKHVLCEKPLALDAEEVEGMQQGERMFARVVMEAFCHIHHPQLARVQDRLRSGAIGRLLSMQMSFGNTLEDAGDFRWHAAMGGGALFDLGCYCVSLMRVLAGEPRSVSAVQVLRGEVDESFSGQLDFGGIVGQFTCSFAAARTQHLEIIGSNGKLLLDWPISTKGRETMLFVNGEAERFAAIDPYVRMVRHFARMAGSEPAIEYGLDWSLAQAQAMDALFAAARGGRVVAVG